MPVEAAGAQQRRVESLGPVGRGQDNDAAGLVEAVHLGEELVEGLLAFVVAAQPGSPAATAADGVDLVDEDDRGGPFARLGEQVAHPGGPDTDEHLHERRAGHRQERDLRLTGHRAGDEGLTSARRAHHDHTTWSLAPATA